MGGLVRGWELRHGPGMDVLRKGDPHQRQSGDQRGLSAQPMAIVGVKPPSVQNEDLSFKPLRKTQQNALKAIHAERAGPLGGGLPGAYPAHIGVSWRAAFQKQVA